MAVNMYDLPALALFINTYAPINFGELYRIGAALKQAVDEASQLFTSLLLKFGEFQSPSAIDTLNYYNQTIGRKEVLDAINQAVSNPDAMKDAGFRSNLLSIFNNIDYSKLSLLKESADNLRMGIQTRAKLKAEGRLKDSWDRSDISTYDTLSNNRVFDDITPVTYMNLNELSTPYFNDLKQGFLRTEYRNGVRYNVIGNNEEDLMLIASAKFNDLMDTPQGQMYYQEFVLLNLGDADAAKEQFVKSIALSLIDRTIRPTYEVDPAWIAQSKGNKDSTVPSSLPNLSTILLNTTISNNLANLGGLSPEERSAVKSGLITQEIYSKAAKNMATNVSKEFLGMARSNVNSAYRLTLDMLSVPLSPDTDAQLLNEGEGTKYKGYKIMNSTSRMILGSDFVSGLMGLRGGTQEYLESRISNSRDAGSKQVWNKRLASIDRLQLAWYNDDFEDVIVKGAGSTVSDNIEVYHRRKAYIPIELLRNIGFKSIASGDFSGIVGAKLVKIGDVLNEEELKIELEREELGTFDEDKASKGTLTRKKIDKSDLYLELDATSPIEIGANEATITRNAQYEADVRKIGAELKYSQAGSSAYQYMGYGK